jgi:hypothetical protein
MASLPHPRLAQDNNAPSRYREASTVLGGGHFVKVEKTLVTSQLSHSASDNTPADNTAADSIPTRPQPSVKAAFTVPRQNASEPGPLSEHGPDGGACARVCPRGG